MYWYARHLLLPDILHRLREQSPLYLVRQLHGHANPLCEHHLVDNLLRQPWLHLLFLWDLYGHADALLEPQLHHV